MESTNSIAPNSSPSSPPSPVINNTSNNNSSSSPSNSRQQQPSNSSSQSQMATATAVANHAQPPSNPTSRDAGVAKRYRSAPAKTFQCRGYGDCHMVFSRSEHLARHIRYVLSLFFCPSSVAPPPPFRSFPLLSARPCPHNPPFLIGVFFAFSCPSLLKYLC